MVWNRIERFFSRREHQILVLVTVAALVLRLMYAFQQGMWVDEGRHAIIAAGLLEHPFQYASHYHGVVTNVPPVYPYMLFLSMAIFGYGKTAVYIVSPIVGALTVFLAYFLGREMFGTEEGLIAATLLAASPVFFFLSERLLIGVTLTFFFTLSVFLFYYGLEDRKYSKYALWATGPAVALSLMSKQPAFTLGPILLIYLLYREGTTPFTNPTEYKNLYIAIGLGVLTMVPYMIRSFSVCNLPMCELEKALRHAGDRSSTWWQNTADMWYYFTNLGALLSLPVAAIVYLRYGLGTLVDLVRKDIELVAKVVGGVVAGSILFLFVREALIPLAIMLGITALQDSKEEKLLWLWISFGVGVLTLNIIKLPRYVIFTVPAFLVLAAKNLSDLKGWAGSKIEANPKAVLAVLAVVVLGLAGLSLSQGITTAKQTGQGFQQLEPAGRWFQDRGDVQVMASSPRQLMFYSGNKPGFEMMPKNNTEIERELRRGKYDYLVVDAYERTRAEYVRFIQRNLAPTDLLTPVEMFENNGRPEVVIFRVNSG